MLDAAHSFVPDSRKSAPFPMRNDAPCYGNAAWGVCYTGPQAERWAEANLRRNGYVTYLPLVTVTRRDRVVRSLRHHVEIPAFPRYLFVQHDNPDLWRPIRETPGVAGVLNSAGRMQYASSRAVEAVRTALAFQATTSRKIPQRASGDAVRAAIGVFKGLPGVVLSVEGEMTRVSVMFLGQLRNVVIPTDYLEDRDG